MNKKIITTGMILGMASVITTDLSYADNISNSNNVRNYSSQYGIVKVDSDDVLNLRKQPNANSEIIGKMKLNTRIEILDSSKAWYKVRFNGIEGYASGRYINIESNNTYKTGVVASGSSNLNVRSKASIDSSIVGKLSSGATVQIEGESINGWYPINYKGTTRYVSEKYVKVGTSSNNQNTQSNMSVIGKIATVNTATLNVRAGAGTNYSVINKVYLGDNVKLLSESTNGWYKISLTSGSTGWCSGTYLKDIRTGSLTTNSSSSNTSSNSDSGSITVENSSEKVKAIINLAKSKLGCPYVWGAEGPNSFDCSGFTYYVYKNAGKVTLPRTSREQAKYGTYVSKENLKPGDLVFFDSNYGSNVNHVGIYIGNNEMIHSPRTGDVVKIQKINTNYYTKAYVTARRVL